MDWDEAPELPPGVRARPPERGVPPRGWAATEALLPEGSVPAAARPQPRACSGLLPTTASRPFLTSAHSVRGCV